MRESRSERCDCQEEKAEWLCIDLISLLLLATILVCVFDRFHRPFLSLASTSVYPSGTLFLFAFSWLWHHWHAALLVFYCSQ